MSRNVARIFRFRHARRDKEGGYLLLELALVLAVSTMLLAAQLNQAISAVDESNAIATAQYMQTLQKAANEYYADNLIALKSGASIQGVQFPSRPKIDELRQYLPDGFPAQSPLGVPFGLMFERFGDCPNGDDCRVSGFANSPPYRDGEGRYRIDLLSTVVANIGLDAGVKMPGTNNFTSVGGASIFNPYTSADGVLTIRIGYGSSDVAKLDQYYRRDGTKKLTGAMDVAGNDIKDVRNLTVNGTARAKNLVVTNDAKISLTAAPGSVCTAESDTAIRRNANGKGLVICSSGVWQLVGHVITDIADGQPCTSAGLLGSNATGLGYVCNGSSWMTMNTTATAGSVCAPDGRTAVTTSREQLICSNGRYVKLANLLSRQVEVSRVLVTDGSVVSKPACELGGTGSYSFHLTQTVVDVSVTPPRQAMYIAATDNGSTWGVKIKAKDNTGAEVSANNYSVSAVMKLECAY